MRYSNQPPALQVLPGTGILVTPWQKQMIETALKNRGQYSNHYWDLGMDVAKTGRISLKLYDHEVDGYVGYRSKSYYMAREIWIPGRAACSCGWKNSGDDVERRAEAHIAKLRAWLDEHPDEETMAGFGGQIAWPPKPKRHKNKAWNKKKRR